MTQKEMTYYKGVFFSSALILTFFKQINLVSCLLMILIGYVIEVVYLLHSILKECKKSDDKKQIW